MRKPRRHSNPGDDRNVGARVIAPRSDLPAHAQFEAEVYLMHGDQGGRHTPIFNNHRPQFSFDAYTVPGAITFPEGTEMLVPGDQAHVTVQLAEPVPMEVSQHFKIHEGTRQIGLGQVKRVIT